MKFVLVIVLTSYAIIPFALAAKILAVFPYPGTSQYIAAESFLKALAARGHELTVATHHPQKHELKNFRDIPLQYENHDEVIQQICNETDKQELTQIFLKFRKRSTLSVLENKEIKALMNDKSQHFDLVIIEALWSDSLYGLAPHFGAHLIGFSTLGTDNYLDDLVGNQSPVSYIPLVTSSFTDNMNFVQRLHNLWMSLFDHFTIYQKVFSIQNEIYQQYFNHLGVPLDEVRRNFSLVLLNQHFSLSFSRPYVPNMIEVGGLFLDHKPKPLPEDLEEFINNAEDGVVYFSMGSNIKTKSLSPEKREAFLKVFSKLRQRVLWKFEDPDLPGKPENVFISKWFPQPDILAHPNVKLFITHSGLLSTIEAIYHAKPIVGIPVFYDQFLNAERTKAAGFGLTLSFRDLNEDNLFNAVSEVLSNPKYKNSAETISARFHDQPMKPLDTAIFWTQYVLRHNGAEHMRVAGRKLNFFQLYSLDTLGFIFGVIALGGFILISLLHKLWKCFSVKKVLNEKKNS